MAKVNNTSASFPEKSIPDETWTAMETAGCVFLPAAGYRVGSNVDGVGGLGYYWSATAFGSGSAYELYFDGSYVNPANDNSRDFGYSVRLVCGRELNCSCTTPTHPSYLPAFWQA